MKKIFINLFIFCAILSAQISKFDVKAAEPISNDMAVGVDKNGSPSIMAPDVTIDDATQYVNKKGYEMVGFIQNIAKPITLVVMVLCGLMAIITSLAGGKDGSSKFMIGFGISSVCYLGVMFAPAILSMLISWAKP